MAEYKKTLNLPATDFPMKANLAQREPKQLQRWQDMNLYQACRDARAGCERYVVHDGPPYANGSPHMGHALNKFIKDAIAKAQSLSGKDAPIVPGWDCHGLPIELNVEKKVGKPGVKVTTAEFREACRKYAQTQVDAQRNDFIRLGILADWQNPYITMDYQYEADTLRVLAELLDKGYVKRGKKPVYWCPLCASAMAEAEVEYKDKKSPAIDVGFTVVDPQAWAPALGLLEAMPEDVMLPIWTTTPWTLPANQAVALNSELDYVLVAASFDSSSDSDSDPDSDSKSNSDSDSISDSDSDSESNSNSDSNTSTQYIIVAEGLLDDVLARYGWTQNKILAKAVGAKLEGLKVLHPLSAREVPVICAEHVTLEAGTGVVHTAPTHGPDDYIAGLKYKLPMDHTLDSRSCFVEGVDVPDVIGMHVFKADKPIIEILQQRGKLLHHADLQHSYPHCWRHKTPVIFRATPQWFIDLSAHKLREEAMAATDKAQWVPAWGRERMQQMLAQRPDWCISRQRTWGTPIAFLIDRQTAALHPDMPAIMEKVALMIEKSGVQAWDDCDIAELIGAEDAERYEKVTDILDVWFDSGVTHACVLAKRKDLKFPADLYFEGSDQHRGWFQSSLLTSVATRGEPPFTNLLTHGYVVDAKGHKMSKSLGNVLAPADVVNQLGADVLRLWAISSNYQNDMNVSKEIITRMTDAYRRIRNTARYLLSNLFDFNPETDAVAVDDLVQLDRWIINRADELQQKIISAYDSFQCHQVYQLVHNFCSNDLGSCYLDLSKDRQYTAKADGAPRRSAQTAMWHILEALVRWLAPMLSFTADEIWSYLPKISGREDSVFLALWHKLPEVNLQEDWQWLMSVRDQVNRALEQARKSGDINGALDAHVTLYLSDERLPLAQKYADEWHFFTLTSSVDVQPLANKSADTNSADTNSADVNSSEDNFAETGLYVEVKPSAATKCARCWQRRDTVGEHAEHADICDRCVTNAFADGESRSYF